MLCFVNTAFVSSTQHSNRVEDQGSKAAPVLLAGSNEALNGLHLTAHVGASLLGQLEGVGEAVHLQGPLHPTPRQVSRPPTHHPPASNQSISQASNQLINRSLNQSIDRSIGQFVCHSISRLSSQSIS